MKFHILAHLKEINDFIPADMKAVGIKAKLNLDYDTPVIDFANKKETVFCPVTIKLSAAAVSGPTWSGSVIEGSLWERVKIGSNGWTYHRDVGRGLQPEKLGDDIKLALNDIKQWLVASGFNIVGNEFDKHTSDNNFGKAYDAIKEALYPRKRIAINCHREAEGDSYNFSCRDGGKFRILFPPSGDAQVWLDGDLVRSVDASDSVRIGSTIGRLLPMILPKGLKF